MESRYREIEGTTEILRRRRTTQGAHINFIFTTLPSNKISNNIITKLHIKKIRDRSLAFCSKLTFSYKSL